MNKEISEKIKRDIDTGKLEVKMAKDILESIKIIEKEFENIGLFLAKDEKDEVYICKKIDEERVINFPANCVFDFFEINYSVGGN